MKRSETWSAYRGASYDLPERIDTWPFTGSGLDSVGVDGRPLSVERPICRDDTLLVRVDAVSLCSSDAKMLRLGNRYPLFYGRDLAQQPTRLGHEVALTVVEVGSEWQERFHPGQRLGLQPDIFVDGLRSCFGVLIPGGLTHYLLLDRRVLDGDAGSYVFSIPQAMSYTATALLEPWACVDAAYVPRRRLAPKPGGTLWIRGQVGDPRTYRMGDGLVSGQIYLTDVPQSFAEWVRSQAPTSTGRHLPAPDQRYDDIILLNPETPEVIEAAADRMAPEGTLTVVSDRAPDAWTPIDVGRIHYEFLSFMGCTGPDISVAYGSHRNRSDLRPGGVTLIAGAGGPMGRMHVQRALQAPDGPQTIIATNRGRGRLERLRADFEPLAASLGRRFYTVKPGPDPAYLAHIVHEITGGRGCDDVVVMAPDAGLMAESVQLLAADGLLALFAGVPHGNKIPLPLHNVVQHQAQFTGTSGSSLADQQRILERIQAGTLIPEQAVAAVGGMAAVTEGLRAVMEGRYAGKVIIFPHLNDLPLLDLDELTEYLPALTVHLAGEKGWSATAEQALFEQMWPSASSSG